MTANIIVAPPHLSFHSSEAEQKFEVFNVHQYPVKFVVKATAPEKYIISNTEGMINTQCKVTITVTHIDVCVTNENVRDKFRIFFSVMNKKKFEPIGHRDITAVLCSQKKSPSRGGEGAAGTHPDSSPSHRPHHHPSIRSIMPPPSSTPSVPPSEPLPPHPDAVQGHHLLVYLVPMVLGVGALWLPTVGAHADIPWYLQISVATKHTICFFLGVLVTLFYRRVQQADR